MKARGCLRVAGASTGAVSHVANDRPLASDRASATNLSRRGVAGSRRAGASAGTGATRTAARGTGRKPSARSRCLTRSRDRPTRSAMSAYGSPSCASVRICLLRSARASEGGSRPGIAYSLHSHEVSPRAIAWPTPFMPAPRAGKRRASRHTSRKCRRRSIASVSLGGSTPAARHKSRKDTPRSRANDCTSLTNFSRRRGASLQGGSTAGEGCGVRGR